MRSAHKKNSQCPRMLCLCQRIKGHTAHKFSLIIALTCQAALSLVLRFIIRFSLSCSNTKTQKSPRNTPQILPKPFHDEPSITMKWQVLAKSIQNESKLVCPKIVQKWLDHLLLYFSICGCCNVSCHIWDCLTHVDRLHCCTCTDLTWTDVISW